MFSKVLLTSFVLASLALSGYSNTVPNAPGQVNQADNAVNSGYNPAAYVRTSILPSCFETYNVFQREFWNHTAVQEEYQHNHPHHHHHPVS